MGYQCKVSEMTDNQRLINNGLKVTLPRMKVLSFLENSQKRHFNAEQIYQALLERGEDVSLATIYRVLSQFEEAGIITRHRFENDCSVFELNDVAAHDHVVCERCGLVKEFSDPTLIERERQIVSDMGFEISYHKLCFYGLCTDCQ